MRWVFTIVVLVESILGFAAEAHIGVQDDLFPQAVQGIAREEIRVQLKMFLLLGLFKHIPQQQHRY